MIVSQGRALVALIGLIASVVVHGQAATSTDATSSSQGSHGNGIQVGGVRLFPTIGLSAGYENNIDYASHDEASSSTVRLSPALHAQAGNARSLFDADLAANLAWYSQSPRDNFSDVTMRASWLYNPVLRHAFGLDGGVTFGHDARGTGSREGDLAFLDLDPDTYRKTDLGGRYQFGAPGARARIEVDGRITDRTYTNNREFTRSRDLTTTDIGGAFFWRVAPKTSAELRIENSTIDYDTASLDSVERHYFVGVEFDPTAKLSGQVLVGREIKNFDDPAHEDTSGASWRVGVKYLLRTYSTLSLTTSRETDETNGAGDFILRRDITLGWNHTWNERFTTGVDGGYAKEDHKPTTRQDTSTFIGVSADYLFRPWLRAGASYRTFNRSSDMSQYDYSRDLILFSIEASL